MMSNPSLKRVRHSLILFVTTTALYGNAAHAYTGEKLAGRGKVGVAQARAIALKVYPGKIVSMELEKENGGSGLRYSFDVRQGASTHEVGVDAQSGTVLENAVEGAHPD